MKFTPMSSRRVGLSLLGILLLGAFAWVVTRTGPLAPIRVTTTIVEEGSLAPALFGIGNVEARRSYLMGPTSASRVRRVMVDIGDSVARGQLLAEMDPVDLDQRVMALDASVARASSLVASANAQIQDAEARKQLAATNARRYVELAGKNFVSTSAAEAKQQEQISALAVTRAAEANFVAAKTDMARLQAERDGLHQQRSNVRLLAPAEGVVTAREAEPGSTVVAGQAVIKMIDPGSMWIRVRLDQGRSTGLAVGLPATITLRSNPSMTLPGKVIRVELISDTVTEERVALVEFDHVPTGVSVGELAEVTLKLPASSSGLLLPNASIRRRGELTGVWVKRDGTLRFVPIRQVSSSLDGKVRLNGSLKAGDEVIVYSEKAVDASSRIRVVDALVAQQP